MNDDDAKPDLSFCTADELIAELAKRNTGLVVSWENTLSDNETEFFCEWKGSLTIAIGLASRSHARLIQMAQSKPLNTDE